MSINSKKMLKFAGFLSQSIERSLLSSNTFMKAQVAGLKCYYPKEHVDDSEWPEQRKLVMREKQPIYTHIKPPKMFKMIRLMRGPERVHNQLIYKGYGVKALLGGRLMYEHFEAIRNMINKKINTDRMFAIWRVDSPWQPLTKKGLGKKLGGGKGATHHYCTPVRADRIILEIGGDLHEIEAKKILLPVVHLLPFLSRFVSQRDLEREKEREKWVEENNINPYTIEYVIKNNMGGYRKWLGKYDFRYFGKYK